MKVQLVQTTDEGMASTVFQSVDDAMAGLEIRGYKFTGLSRNYADVLASNPRAAVARKELWDQPKFDGLAGPMWGGEENGEPILRYEDWKAYDKLST